MPVETLPVETAASVAAEDPTKTAPSAVEAPPTETPATVPPPEETPAEKPAEGEPIEETEPDLEAQPETSGDFAKYKPLFKDNPELRNIIGRERAYSELGEFSEVREIVQRIPTIADAETLVSDAENKRILGQTFREDLPAFVESLKESDPLAFQNFAKQLPELLAETDEALWVEQARTYTGRVLSNAFSIAQSSGDAELQKAVDMVARSLGVSIGQQPSQPARGNSEVERLRRELADRNKQDADAEFDSFWNETDGAIISSATSEIESAIRKALPAVEDAQLGRMKKEAYEQVLGLLNAQPQTVSQVNSYREAAQKGRRGIADHKAIVNFMTQRARQVIPKAVKSVVDEWSGKVLKLNTDKLNKRKDIAASTKDVGSGPQGTTSAATSLPSNTNGKPRSADTILKELAAGTYVARK
jgi:hypothetical protein